MLANGNRKSLPYSDINKSVPQIKMLIDLMELPWKGGGVSDLHLLQNVQKVLSIFIGRSRLPKNGQEF